MNRETLRRILPRLIAATEIFKRIRDTNRCGGSGDDLEPALNYELDTILELLGESCDQTEPETRR